MTLKVIWSGGHVVMVEVLVEPPLDNMVVRGQELADAVASNQQVARRHDIDEAVLRDEPALYDALRRWTLPAPPDSVVRAQIVSPRLYKLLKLLRVTPPVPDPIPVPLPDA